AARRHAPHDVRAGGADVGGHDVTRHGGRLVRAGLGLGLRVGAVATDPGHLTVAAVERDVGAAVEVLVAVRAHPVGEDDVVAAAIARQRHVPVVVVLPAGAAGGGRVGHGVDQLEIAPCQRASRVPALLGDVDVEPS